VRPVGLTREREQKAEQHLETRGKTEEGGPASSIWGLTWRAASQKPASA
jgi:hypothetical protein